jgi:diguanylate cyclase (GGDEF)-like protein/PAS domain S-box-containing protein
MSASVPGADLSNQALPEQVSCQTGPLNWAHRFAELCGVDLFVTDPETGRFIDCNPAAARRLGYSRAELLQLGPAQIQADADHDPIWVAQTIRQQLRSGAGSVATRHRCRDGSVLDVQVTHTTARLEGRTVLVAAVENRTPALHAQQALEEQLRLFQQAETVHGAAGWHHHLETGAMGWTPQIQTIAGCAPADFAAYLNLVHPDDRERLRHKYHLAVQRCERLDLPHRLRHTNGDERQVLLSALPRCHGLEGSGQVLGTLTDTTTHHTLLQNAEQIRLRDPLTDLPNKIATLEWLDRQLSGRSHNANLTILSLDIDGFQEINDSFGHDTGDRLLRTFATVLVSQLAAEAWVGRLGSDEFVVIYQRGIGSLGEAIHLARELQLKLHAFDKLSPELPLRPTVSMGVSCFPEHSHAALPLLQCANTALMEAKRQGRGQLRAYSTTLSRQIRERLVLDVALHKAISREQLRILVQPQMDRSGLLCGGEVLLRWRDHQGKEISPGFFIPLAEQSGLIFPISNWVLEATLEQISQWRLAKLNVPRLGINISTRLLESSDRRLPDQLHRALANHRLSPEALELEITETALLRNPIAAAETVRNLANEGFQIAIDDFGTGYSSMDLLRTLPVHKLKIDSTFIRNIGHSPEDHSIVASTITLAHGLGMLCIAEGVETEIQRDILLNLGCDQFQGYFYGRPGSVDGFGQLLREPQGSPSKRQADPIPQTLSIPIRARATSFDELEALRGVIDSSLDAYGLMQTLFGPAGEIIDFTLLEANATACSYMRQERDAVVGQTLCTLFPGVVTSGLLERLAACMHSRTPLELDDFAYPNHEVYGDTRVYDLRAYPSNNLLTLTWRDVTLRSRRYRDLAETADLLELLTQNVMGTLVLLDEQQQITWVSASVFTMTGWTSEQWLGRPFGELFATASGVPEPVDLCHWLPQPGQAGSQRLRLASPRGGWSWVEVSCRHLNGHGLRQQDQQSRLPQEAKGFVLTLHPADEIELKAQRQRQEANTDPLTQLLQRTAVLEHLDQRLGMDASAEGLALLALSCDNFKAINRAHGYAAGDAVLQQLARRLRQQIRQDDRAARLSGDEFLVLLEAIPNQAAALEVAEKLVAALAQPIDWQGSEIPVSLSVGVAIQGADDTASQLLGRANQALDQAQAAGGHQIAGA